jgi:hypothetical protein
MHVTSKRPIGCNGTAPQWRPLARMGLASALSMALGACMPASSTSDGTGGVTGSTGGATTEPAASTGGAVGTLPSGGTSFATGGAGTGGAGSGGSGSGGSSGDTSGSGGATTGPETGSGGSGSGGTGPSGGPPAGTGGAPAGTGQAGATGTGPGPGAGGGSTSPGCAGKSYKLCEDFETGTAGAIPTGWTTFKGYGAAKATDVGLATDQFHSGTMSLKSDSASTGQSRVQKSLSALGATASKHWGRIFYKVQSPAAKNASGVLHVTFVGLNGSTTENRVVDIVEASNGTHQWLFNNPNDKGSLGSAYSWSFDTAWHCAEWYVDVSTNSYRFFTDSKEVTTIGFTGKTDSQMSNYSAIIVGATFYQSPNAAFIMWFDDLAINDTQIGCM